MNFSAFSMQCNNPSMSLVLPSGENGGGELWMILIKSFYNSVLNLSVKKIKTKTRAYRKKTAILISI